MKITLQTDGEADHEQMVILWNIAVAAQLRTILTEGGLDAAAAWRHAESVTFGLAYFLDEGEFVVNDQVFKPRIAFAGEDGALLPGAAAFDYAHEYASVSEEDLADGEGFSISA